MTHEDSPEHIIRITGVDADKMSDEDVAVAALFALRSRQQPAPVDEQATREAADRKRWNQSVRSDAPRDWRHSLR